VGWQGKSGAEATALQTLRAVYRRPRTHESLFVPVYIRSIESAVAAPALPAQSMTFLGEAVLTVIIS
jgi:hypothetical protein